MSPSDPLPRRTSTRHNVRRLSTSSSLMPRKYSIPSFFNIARGCVYVAVFLWAIICLAIAIHFHTLLVSSDLTHFVPFAIFVSGASMAIVLILFGSTFLRRRNPVSTRVELSGLALMGVLWLGLGVFLAISESADADVECFSTDSSDSNPVDFPNFSTETYHAQYHVLEAFSLFNMVLVWGFLLIMLFLSLKQHRMGIRKVWVYPMPLFPWFDREGQKNMMKSSRKYSLPQPVSARPSQRRSNSRRHAHNEKSATKSSSNKVQNRMSAFWVWVDKPKSPPDVYTRDRRREQPRRTTSGRR